MKKFIPSLVLALVAGFLGATAHEYFWPHYSLEMADNAVIKGVSWKPWNGYELYAVPNAVNAEISNSSVMGRRVVSTNLLSN